MGEVYRARDPRLQRDVAIKVLPSSFTNDAERLRRFEQEARAVAALNHSNIVAIHDLGSADGVHYIVSELLEGETLRQRLMQGPIPVRKAVELAIQLANGLAAAHEKGIVHRDLKPENIFITRSGQLKILDFGLAKLRRNVAGPENAESQTVAETEAGIVMGTAGYMAPEQVKGAAADSRTDIFTFGSIMYEMLNGQRAFKRDTGAETMTAILNDEPPEFTMHSGALAPGLERVVRHCMEKQPVQRFQSAHDIAFALESLSGISGTAPVHENAAAKSNSWIRPALAALVLLAAGLAVGAWVRTSGSDVHPKLHRITFRRGTIWNARFTPDGNIIYGAAWEGHPIELYAAQTGSTESRPLGVPSTGILAVANSGELAVATNFNLEGFESSGMLARAPIGGGAPREIAAGVEYADWAADGNNLAIVRRVGGKDRLEYPMGKILYESAGWISHPRISRDGKWIAFVDHPYERDDAGTIAAVDMAGNKKTLTGKFVSAQGLAWSANGSEVWFTGTTSGSSRELRAVTVSGKERLVYLGTGTLTLHDIARDGRVLFTRDDLRAGMIALAPGATKESDLSWHDWTVPRDLSNDGSLISFDETGEAGGETGAVYVRGSDGSPAVRLGEGRSPTLSGDGKWVLSLGTSGKNELLESPTGAGESRIISSGDVHAQLGYFFPDGQHVLIVGNAPGHGLRLWKGDTRGGTPKPIGPEGAIARRRQCISPDGKRVAARDPNGGITIYEVDGDGSTTIPNVQPGEDPIQWTKDATSLLVGGRGVPSQVFSIDVATKERKLLKSFMPADPTGLFGNAAPTFSSDLSSYVYSYQRITSDLYIVDGLK